MMPTTLAEKPALRGLDILYGAGMNVKVLHVTDGKDPDEFVKKKEKRRS